MIHTVLTGATSGIGTETALGLARAGQMLTLGVRDTARGMALATRLRAVGAAAIHLLPLDLASLASVRGFAEAVRAGGQPIDALINNAGVLGYPSLTRTEDGSEMQWGVNHLAHFALTAQLMPQLLAAPAPRVVTVASLAHKRAALDLDDPDTTHSYAAMRAYARSKLANLTHALELERRARAAGVALQSLAAHPGWSATNITAGMGGPTALKRRMAASLFSVLAQSPARGALPTLHAALSPTAIGGGYYGPDGPGEIWGRGVKPAFIAPQARDPALGARLWTLSEDRTGIKLVFA